MRAAERAAPCARATTKTAEINDGPEHMRQLAAVAHDL